MQLSKVLTEEINAYDSTEPNVKIFVDESAIFWVSKDEHFVWLQDHTGLSGPDVIENDDENKEWNPDYVNETHKVVDEKMPEGVGNYGVYWMNEDFENPFHISDFTKRIATINAIVNK